MDQAGLNSSPKGLIPLVIIFGGVSAEHEVSCISAAHILKAIDPLKYEIHMIGITQAGDWVEACKDFDITDLNNIPEMLRPEGTSINPTQFFAEFSERQPVVWPVLHGPNGEDGTIQGFLELISVPYIGSGVLSSALCMDKLKTKEILNNAGINQTKWISIHATEIEQFKNSSLGIDLKGDLFVKPSNMGSSIGISKVTDRNELFSALRKAAEYDDWIVIEEATNGREIELSVLGNRKIQVSVPGEIIPGAEFYDYNDKYKDGARLEIPAKLSRLQTKEAQDLALKVYKLLRCQGLARVDFFFEEENNVWLVNEVNTMPGFTPISMFPKLWSYSGISYKNLIERLITDLIRTNSL